MAHSTPSARQMSLVPYVNDSREIVLRRGNAVVLYDTDSRQLSVRDASDQPMEMPECPYCHRPLRNTGEPPSEQGNHGRGYGSDMPFVDPDYFAMLAASQRPSPATSGQSTPNRHVLPPALRSGRSRETSGSANPPTGAEFVASTPSTASGKGISSSAFSPGYFRQFFKEECELGRGGNGVVLLVEHIMDDVSLGRFACKRIPVGDSHTWLEKVLVEVKLLQRIPHKNIVTCHWTWLEDFQPTQFGPSIPCLWILQEYCNGGDLHSYVLGPKEVPTPAERLKDRLRRRSRGNSSPRNWQGGSRLSLEEIFSFFRDITSGLHHLHSKGYIHRDLKPSNCLLQRDGGKTRVLISDFGEVQEAGTIRGSTGATGTISYCAPEVLQRDRQGSFGNFTTKSDVFSLGMIVYFMCFGRLPYTNADDINEENEDLEQLRAEITQWPGFDDETKARADLPERLYKFLKRLLSVDPNERPSTDEILASIKGGVALGEFDGFYEDRNPRVSAVDSPAPNTSTRRRKQSALVPQTNVGSPIRRDSSETLRSRSPTKRDRSRAGQVSPTEGFMALRPRNVELPPSTSVVASPQQSPRLMLPPPPPRPIIHRLVQVTHHPRAFHAFRALIFLVKLLSLSIPCTPYSAKHWVLYPLLVIATLELGMYRGSARQSLVTLSLHLTIVLVAYQYSCLCEGTGLIDWDDIR